MKSAKASKPGHVTKGNVLEDLGLTPGEIVELRVKTDLWRDLVARTAPLSLTQKGLAQRLGVHQPEVSNLLAGKLSKFSVGTLIQFAVKMDLGVQVKTTGAKNRTSTITTLRAETGVPKSSAKARRMSQGATVTPLNR